MNPSRRQALQLGGLLVFTALAGRTVYVQAIEGPELAEKADARELDHNPRSAPVRLRAAARLRPADQAPSPEVPAPFGGRGVDPGHRSGQRAARRRHRS